VEIILSVCEGDADYWFIKEAVSTASFAFEVPSERKFQAYEKLFSTLLSTHIPAGISF